MGVPCHFKETVIGGDYDNIREDCVRDRDAVLEYLSNMSTVAWYNYSTFKHSQFKEDRIVRQSSLLQYKTIET